MNKKQKNTPIRLNRSELAVPGSRPEFFEKADRQKATEKYPTYSVFTIKRRFWSSRENPLFLKKF